MKRLSRLLKKPATFEQQVMTVPPCSDIEAMQKRARRYEENTGVALKDGVLDDHEIDWTKPFKLTNADEAARRCLARHRAINPSELTLKQLQILLDEVKGYEKESTVTESDFHRFQANWVRRHEEEIEKVTYDNVALYNEQYTMLHSKLNKKCYKLLSRLRELWLSNASLLSSHFSHYLFKPCIPLSQPSISPILFDLLRHVLHRLSNFRQLELAPVPPF